MITCEMLSIRAFVVVGVNNSGEAGKRLYTQMEFLLCLDVLHGDQSDLHHRTLFQRGHFQLNQYVMDYEGRQSTDELNRNPDLLCKVCAFVCLIKTVKD